MWKSNASQGGSSVLTWHCNQLQTQFSCDGSVATCQQWLCTFVSLFLLAHCWVGADRESSSLTVPCDQNAVVWLILLALLPSHFCLSTLSWRRLWRPSSPQVSSPWKGRAGLFETYRGFVFQHITCLQEICLHKLDGRVSGMFALLSVARKDLQLYFYLSSQICCL